MTERVHPTLMLYTRQPWDCLKDSMMVHRGGVVGSLPDAIEPKKNTYYNPSDPLFHFFPPSCQNEYSFSINLVL